MVTFIIIVIVILVCLYYKYRHHRITIDFIIKGKHSVSILVWYNRYGDPHERRFIKIL